MAATRIAISIAVFVIAVRFADAAPNNNGGFDHRAHAVPGGPYAVPDTDSDGFAWVTLNGELSHSHFFNPKTGSTGKITKYVWTTGNKVICRKMVCSVKFRVGKTIVKLEVTDITGDVAASTTAVNVYKGAKTNVRLLYYPGNGWISDEPSPNAKPSLSQTVPVINFGAKEAFPQFVRDQKFSIRALGNIDLFRPGTYRFRLECPGAFCTLWIGNTLILNGGNKKIDSKPMMFSKSQRRIRIVFRRKPSKRSPKFILSWMIPGTKGFSLVPAKFLSHNPSIYPPVVHFVKPPRAGVGSVITIVGSSLGNVKRIKIGKLNCAGPVPKNQFSVTCVVPGGSGKQKLTVHTDKGSSNSVSFQIVEEQPRSSAQGRRSIGYYQPIKFRQDFLKKAGKLWRAPQLTSIALGPDNRYYMGSLNGFVHVVQTDLGNQVKKYCKSTKVGNSRSILGVAFNPAETGLLRLYASTSVLYWGTKKLLPFTKGWHNGEIIAMQKTKNTCLTKVATVISGLPVSNYDHAVNGITFDNNGNLLVSIGGSSNAGVSKKGDPLGGVPDSPFSGSIVVAPILRKGFNGKVTYNQYNNPGTANKVGGQVSVYASGLRNSMCHTAHSNGQIYATDNGANANFGARSTGCKSSAGVVTERDTLKKVKRGGFYGFANRNRGRYDKRQCLHRPPQSNIGGYDKAIAKLESSTNGIVEYTANTFGAQMREDLVLTKFAVSGNGKTFRVKLNKEGNVQSKFEISQFSGLTVAMSPSGGLIMPRVYQSKVAVMLPVEKNPGKLVVTSVNPFRGPKRGGGRITITGWNLHGPLSVRVGGRECRNVADYKNGRSITCIVPKGSGKAAVVVSRFGKKSQSYGFEYLYMNI